MTKVSDMIAWAQAEIGKPYVYGDEGPSSFDCSGLVQYVLGKVGISAPRTAKDQQQWATPIKSPSPGDLVFYGTPAHHVGIYIGGGKMIAAPHTGALVQQQDVYGSPTYGRVPGLGLSSLLTPVSDTASTVASTTGDMVSGILGSARDMVARLAAGALGLALIGTGVYRVAIAPTAKRQAAQALEAL